MGLVVSIYFGDLQTTLLAFSFSLGLVILVFAFVGFCVFGGLPLCFASWVYNAGHYFVV